MQTKSSTSSFLLMLFFAVGISAQSAGIESIYTDLNAKNCKTLEQSNEYTGWYRGECPGIGGYKLQVTEGDIRQSIDVVAPNKKKYQLDFTSIVSGGFSSVGEKAEWRVTRKGKIITPTAFIVRYNASENPEDSTKITSYLVVTKITKEEICITDIVKPDAKANEEARKLADSSPTKPCKVSEN
ncbi:MAG: hypothetical protein LH472_10945 [Pyrinomonadaceae bacterium]|nr:hypothetical protein [Pyrinomonadaceae bacterium]